MTIDQIINIIGLFATWITVFFVFLTLKEMEKQRKEALKPEIVIPNVSIYGYSTLVGEYKIATYWTTNEIRPTEFFFANYPKFDLYNIGSGPAKKITILWDFAIDEIIQVIQKYCVEYDIPIEIEKDGNYVSINLQSESSIISLETKSEFTHLLSSSINPSGTKSDLPLAYIYLVSILLFLENYHFRIIDENKEPVLFIKGSKFKLPSMSCKIKYEDIGGNKFCSKFNVLFEPHLLGIPNKARIHEMNKPVLYGVFEFTQIKS